jgi:predicted dehydrogenase
LTARIAVPKIRTDRILKGGNLSLANLGDVLRIGIAGLGEATTEFLPDYVKHPKVKVTAAADFRQAARDRFQQEVKGKAYQTFEEICQSSEVDIVYIATPHELHAHHTLMALKCGKHVIVEKPMALTVEDCDPNEQRGGSPRLENSLRTQPQL